MAPINRQNLAKVSKTDGQRQKALLRLEKFHRNSTNKKGNQRPQDIGNQETYATHLPRQNKPPNPIPFHQNLAFLTLKTRQIPHVRTAENSDIRMPLRHRHFKR